MEGRRAELRSLVILDGISQRVVVLGDWVLSERVVLREPGVLSASPDNALIGELPKSPADTRRFLDCPAKVSVVLNDLFLFSLACVSFDVLLH